MKVKLTDRFVDRVKASGPQTEYFDEGLTGLALRVTPKVKAWTYHYSFGGKRQRAPLGSYPATSLASARTKALEAQALVEDGHDPRNTTTDSLKAVAEEWKKRNEDLRTLDRRWKSLERLVFPSMGQRPIKEIRRSEIVRLIDTIEDERGPDMADATLGFLSSLFNWHAARDDDFTNPIIRGMRRSNGNARHRILTDEEIRKVWQACDGPYGRYIRFLLLTAVRRGEAAKAQWSEVVDDVWTVPAERMKGKVDHVVPLSEAAKAAMRPEAGKFVFTTSDVRGITNFAVYKAQLDKASGVSGWRIHDLRRTARSLLSRAGVPSDIAERCLAHLPGGVRGIYDRYEYFAEKREALEKLAGLIGAIVEYPTAAD